MYKEVLRSIEGVGIFPSISLLLFFGFFVGLIIYLIRKKKSYWDEAAQLPLADDNTNYEGQIS